MATLVSRASHVHQAPQVGLPQMAPLRMVIPVKSTPSSAEDRATAIRTVRPYLERKYQAYVEWDLLEGQTVTIILPKDPIVFHDPFRSTWNPSTKVPNFVDITAPMTLRRMTPANVGTWDEASKTFLMAGPFEMGGAMPLFDGLPRIDFGPKR